MKKKGPERRRPTSKELSRASEAKLKRYFTNAAIDWAESDPEVRRQMVAQVFGYKIPDPVEKSHSELAAFIDAIAIKRLKEDDKFAQAVAEARIRQITQDMGLQIKDQEPQKPLTMDDLIDRAKKIKELKEIIGVREPTFWDTLMNPNVIAGIFTIIHKMLIEKQPPPEDKGLGNVQKYGGKRPISTQKFPKINNKEPPEYIASDEPSEPDKEANSIEPKPEPESPNKTEGQNDETPIDGAGI